MKKQISTVAIVGRFLIAVLFLLSGFSKIAAPAATQGYMASMGLPIPMLGYLIAIAIEIGGSVLLLVGFQVRIVAFVMFCFTIATALIFHRNLSDQSQLINFLKNLAIAGGLLQVVAFGGGSFSVDARMRHRVVSKEPAPLK
jgi:putative oxidoreductase